MGCAFEIVSGGCANCGSEDLRQPGVGLTGEVLDVGMQSPGEVLVETATNPTTPGYLLCAFSGANPEICGTSAAHYALLRDPAFKSIDRKAAPRGCAAVVQAGKIVRRIAVVEGVRRYRAIGRALERGKKIIRSLGTPIGVNGSMHHLVML